LTPDSGLKIHRLLVFVWLGVFFFFSLLLTRVIWLPSNFVLPQITEAMLFEKFNAVGPVASIRVCRDAITRRSLGYAYVNFVNAADASTALNDMNFDPIAGRPCRIMWSQRDPATRRSGVGNIFIKNLDKSIDNKALFDTFGAFGDILSCKVVQDINGESRGFGFVHYSTQKAADESIEKVNGMLLCDQKVYVGPFKSRDVRVKDMASREQEFTNLYVKNLDEDVTEEKLGEMFGKYGNVTSRKIMMGAADADDADSKSKCFGFVAFETNDMAKAAVEALHDSETEGGKKLYVTRAQKRAERLAALQQQHMAKKAENQARYKGVNLYVKNLDDTITDDKLREAFEEFGAITSAKIMRDERQQSKGFGFVCFNSADEATKAVTEMNGKIIEKKPLYVALAQRKDERRRQIAMAHNQRLHSMRMQQQMFPAQGMPGAQPNSMYMMPQMAGQVPAGYGRYQPGMAAGMARPPANYMRQQQQQQQMMAAGQFRGAMPGQQGQQVRMQQQGGARGNQRQAGRGQGKGRQPYNVRQQQQMQQQQPPAQQPALLTQGQEPLTASALASASNAEQKQMLGERLFPLIQSTHSEQAGKITGMLLEMDNSELLHLLEDGNALSAKTQEAVKVLEDHSRQVQDGGAK
jgi:polyadenylate-binding protein